MFLFILIQQADEQDIEEIPVDQEDNQSLKDDDDQSRMDIDEFERRLKQFKGEFSNDSDDFQTEQYQKQNKPNKPPLYTTSSLQPKSLLSTTQMSEIPKNPNRKSRQELSKIDEIQRQLAQSKKVRTFDDEVDDIVQSKNESIKDKKIRELAQKNKSLQLNYEKEKAGRQKLEMQLLKIQKETDEKLQKIEQSQNPMNSSINKTQRPNSASKQQQQDPLMKALKGPQKQQKEELTYDELKLKYKDADKKVQELRIQVQNSKNDFNKAMRVIQREVGGENVNIDQLLMEDNSWKGRAQQIEKLKAKVRLQKLNCIILLIFKKIQKQRFKSEIRDIIIIFTIQ